MEELEESVWSVAQQENERKDQGESVQNSGKTSNDVWGRDMGVDEGTGKELEVAEMRMLRWMCAFTKLDKIRNERIRGTTEVGEITKKVQERRLEWYGHVMRREEQYVGRSAMVMKVQGRRKRGRPKRIWLDKVKDDIKEKGLMMCTALLHGGVCKLTSTPHKSGNKMKEKEKKKNEECGKGPQDLTDIMRSAAKDLRISRI